ncbi:hypothetical protein [Clostridium sp. ZS2-4]|nr:hypothetical protein [Clostridium sp. ZS2-4]MCY6355178.1 hypothetical protein [Clostridium sp. ZS2-4]
MIFDKERLLIKIECKKDIHKFVKVEWNNKVIVNLIDYIYYINKCDKNMK